MPKPALTIDVEELLAGLHEDVEDLARPAAGIGGIYTGQYDEGYFLPHIQLPQEIGTYTGAQSGNGWHPRRREKTIECRSDRCQPISYRPLPFKKG